MKIIILILYVLISVNIFPQNFDFMGIPTNYTKKTNNYNNRRELIQAENPIILNSFASPISLPTDIAAYQNNLYVIGYGEYKIYVIDTNTGQVNYTIPINILKPYGISIDSNYAYVLDNINHKIVKINLQTEVVEDSIFLNTTNSYPTGLVFANGNLWLNDARGPSPSTPNDTTINFNFSGQFFKGYYAKGDYPTGLAWDGTNLYSTDNVNQIIYKLNPQNFEILEAINAPGGNYPNGLSFDGNNLWLINNASDSIYKIQVNQNVTNVNNYNNKNNFNIYPNPANTCISIDLDINKNTFLSVNIYDVNGNIVRYVYNKNIAKGNQKIKYNISDLSDGIYIIQEKTDYYTKSKKLIVKNN